MERDEGTSGELMKRVSLVSGLGVLLVSTLFLGGCGEADRRIAVADSIPGVTVEFRRIALPGHLYWPVYYILEREGSNEVFRSEAVYFIDRDVVDTMRFEVKTGLREGEWEVVWENRTRGSLMDAEFHPFLLVYPARFWSFPRVRSDRAGSGQGFRDGQPGGMVDWD